MEEKIKNDQMEFEMRLRAAGGKEDDIVEES